MSDAGTKIMFSKFKMPQDPLGPERAVPQIDIGKRYDVYCHGMHQRVVVYRNALFKGRASLMSTGRLDFRSEFVEIEQSNGQSVFLSTFSVFKFCEHGVECTAELVRPQI